MARDVTFELSKLSSYQPWAFAYLGQPIPRSGCHEVVLALLAMKGHSTV